MRFFLIFITLLFLSSSFAEDAKKNVQAIVNSVTKNSEKPLIDQGSCCPVCSDSQAKKYEECSKDLPLKMYEEKAKLDNEGILLIPGKIYEIRMNPKNREEYILGKSTGLKYFTISKDSKDFIGAVVIKTESADEKFIREYSKLEDIYIEAKFKELCQFLGTNQEKYSRLKAKLTAKKTL